MSVVSNLETIKSNAYLFKAYSILNFNDPNNFVYFIGLCSFFAIFISSLFSIFAIWQLAKFNSSINAQFANRLYSYFMGRSWNFHISKSSSELVQKIALRVRKSNKWYNFTTNENNFKNYINHIHVRIIICRKFSSYIYYSCFLCNHLFLCLFFNKKETL